MVTDKRFIADDIAGVKVPATGFVKVNAILFNHDGYGGVVLLVVACKWRCEALANVLQLLLWYSFH